MTNVQIIQNEGEWTVKGQLDLDTDASILATRGTNMTATKTATGEYSVVIKGTANLKLVEMLQERSNFSGAEPAGAIGNRVESVTQASDGTDDITIVLKTTLLAGGVGADTDTTAAVTLNFEVVIRVVKMGNPL